MDCAARDRGLTHDGRSDPMIQLPARTPPGANRVPPPPRHDKLLAVADSEPGPALVSSTPEYTQHLVADGVSAGPVATFGSRGQHACTGIATPVLPPTAGRQRPSSSVSTTDSPGG